MIRSKQDFKQYVRSDINRQNMHYPILSRFTFGEHNRVKKYLYCLRRVEYHKNSLNRNLCHKIAYALCFLNLRRLSLKYSMYIAPNTVGPGFLLPHPGFVRIGPIVSMGKNCTVLPMVLFGKKSPDTENASIVVGDNCYFGTGCTVLGPVKIGDNVVVGAGAVVTKDIPSNCIAVGVPACTRQR